MQHCKRLTAEGQALQAQGQTVSISSTEATETRYTGLLPQQKDGRLFSFDP